MGWGLAISQILEITFKVNYIDQFMFRTVYVFVLNAEEILLNDCVSCFFLLIIV